MPASEPLLKVEGLTKRFPGVVALSEATLEASAGEVHGICGENGAGKSTLIKVLTGAHFPDSGTIHFDGAIYNGLTPRKAMDIGIACIYQEQNLIPHLTVTENIFLGREIHLSRSVDVIDRRAMRAKAAELLADLGVTISPTARVGTLGVGHQQMIEICRAMWADAKLIIMDEPTSSLSGKEADDLFRVIRQMKARGVTILFISHRLDEVRDICDRVTVMRDGKTVSQVVMEDSSIDEIIKLMVGRNIQNKYPKEKAPHGDVILSVRHLARKNVLHDISFDLKAGEVLGFAGLVGAGRTETARAITGADPHDSGVVEVYGKPVSIRRPLDSINAGIAFLTESRKEQGLILIQSVVFNTAIVKMQKYATNSWLNIKKMKETAEKTCAELRLKATSMDMSVNKLSGGNQQKVVIAKWLVSNAKIFIFDEPTRGIDVGAKVEVYKLINQLVAKGAGVIIICSEMDEVLGMADRIIVMHEGEITAEMQREEATQEKIMYAASGFKQTSSAALAQPSAQ
jgi:ribose transport system ATP-binding protein